MVIVCACESPLGPPYGDVVRCTQCPRTYPTKETVQILKLLKLAARETDNDGKSANEHVRRTALNKAAHKLAALKLKVFDENSWRPPAPPPVRYPIYAATATATATTTGNPASTWTHVVVNVGGFSFGLDIFGVE